VKINRALLMGVLALAVALLTARLGWWQLDRAAQKTALQQALDERRALPFLSGLDALARTPEAVPAQQHRRAQLQGQWLPEHTVYLENRPMDARTGFYVVTPLRLADGSVVLVQRGWLPRDLRDRTRLPDYRTPRGPVAVQGRIAPALARLYEFEAAASGPFRQNLPVEAYGRETGLPLRPWVLVQEDIDTAQAVPPAAPPDGLLRQWPAPSTGVHKHQGYAFQWFSLSALTLVLYVWFQFIRPHRRRAR